MRGNSQKLTEAQVTQMIKEYADGERVKDLTTRYCVHLTTFYDYIDKNHVPRRGIAGSLKSQSIVHKDAQVKELYEQGLSYRQIAFKVGISFTSVRGCLLRTSTPIRHDFVKKERPTVPQFQISQGEIKKLEYLERRKREVDSRDDKFKAATIPAYLLAR